MGKMEIPMTRRKLTPGPVGVAMQIGVMTALLLSVLGILAHSFINLSPQAADVSTEAMFIVQSP
jgi:hypothetical protein